MQPNSTAAQLNYSFFATAAQLSYRLNGVHLEAEALVDVDEMEVLEAWQHSLYLGSILVA